MKKCLQALERQTLPPEKFEVICINDGSSDGQIRGVMLDALERLPGKYREHFSNKGLAAARNTAIRMAKGEYFLFINDDTIAAPDLLEQHLNWHLSNPGARTAVLGGFDFSRDLLNRSAVLRVFSETSLVFAYSELKAGQTYDYTKFWTANVSVSRKGWEAAGDFDEKYKQYGAEDTEWGYRLQKNGYRVLYAPWAKASHEHDMSSVSGFCTRQENVASNFILFFRSHPETIWPSLSRVDRISLEKHLAALQSERSEVFKKAESIASHDLSLIGPTEGQQELVSALKPLLQWLHKFHWAAGFVKGLKASGSNSFEELGGWAESKPPPSIRAEPLNSNQRHRRSPEVSVIVPSFNRATILRECLQALANQEFPFGTFEIIVVDDGSSDRTPEIVQNAKSSFETLYFRQENSGPAAARNLGIRHARGEIILILNDDAIAFKDLVAGHYAIHRDKKCERMAVLGTREYRAQDKLRLFNFLYDQVPLSMRIYGMEEVSLPAPYFVTFNISLTKKDFDAFEGFDEDFRTAIGEDSEFGTRWQNAGGTIFFSPRLRAYHYHDLTVDGLKSMIIREAFNGLILYNKHKELWRPKSTEILLRPEPEMREFIHKVESSMDMFESIMRRYESSLIWEIEGTQFRGIRIDNITDFVIAVREIYPKFYEYTIISQYLNNPTIRDFAKRWFGPSR